MSPRCMILVALTAVTFPAGAEPDERPGATAASFRAGSAVIDVTPPVGLPMWGYGVRKAIPAVAVRDPLLATTLVIEAAEKRLAIVGLDMGRAPARTSLATLRARVRSEASVDVLFVVASHTHHGPCLELESLEPTASYIRTLIDKLARSVNEAAANLRPAAIGARSASVDLNRNRHSRVEPAPVDRELTVVRLDGQDGKSIACLVNFAAHPTTLAATRLEYSPDFPGPMRTHVEAATGSRCVFLQGAAGDLSTRRSPAAGTSTPEGFGAELGRQVVRIYETIEVAVPESPSIGHREEELRFDLRVDLEDPLTYAMYCLAFFPGLIDTYVEEYRGGLRPNLTVAVLNGEIGIVGASGEFFCEHAMRLRSRARLQHMLFLGYCNGYHQYFPTIEAAAEGGYGADPEVSPAEVGAGERVMDRALFHLYDLRKPFRTRLPAGR